MKLYTLILGLLLSVSAPAQAIPTLLFDGSVAYSQTTGMLTVEAVLTGYQDVSSTVAIGTGSSFSFTTSLMSVTSGVFTTSGSFGTSSFSIFGADSTYLLGGDLTGLTMTGVHGFDFGSVTGGLTVSGGSLLGDFGIGADLLALQFNLSTVFDSGMFGSDFTAQLDGKVEAYAAVPEASTLLLMSFVILVGGFVARKRG